MELKIEQVTKTYGAKHALNQFSVVLKEGIYGLLGPNGAGKSTLMNIITDNLAATSGTVYWEGKKIQSLGKQYREILGYMPQQQGMYDEFTVEHFLWYMASLKGMKRKDAKEQINQLLSVVNMTQNRKKLLKGLSGGMKQRVLLAQALLNDPEILFLDEPTAGLDVEGRISLHEEIRKLRERGKTVILASHDMAEVETLCDRIAILNEGIINFCGTPAELTEAVGKKYTVEIRTSQGTKPSETEHIADTLLSLLTELKEKQAEILDIRVDRGTLEQHFLEMAGRAAE